MHFGRFDTSKNQNKEQQDHSDHTARDETVDQTTDKLSCKEKEENVKRFC